MRGVYLLIDVVNHDKGTGREENLVKLHLRAKSINAKNTCNQNKYISDGNLQECELKAELHFDLNANASKEIAF